MAKTTNLSFSRPHDSGSGEHVDTYRTHSDSSGTEKIEHSPSTPGTVGSSQTANIPVRTKN